VGGGGGAGRGEQKILFGRRGDFGGEISGALGDFWWGGPRQNTSQVSGGMFLGAAFWEQRAGGQFRVFGGGEKKVFVGANQAKK